MSRDGKDRLYKLTNEKKGLTEIEQAAQVYASVNLFSIFSIYLSNRLEEKPSQPSLCPQSAETDREAFYGIMSLY